MGILQGRDTQLPRIHFYAAPDTIIQSTTKHNVRVPSYAPTRSSILPAFKRLAACFDPSCQSFALPVYVLLQAPLICCVSLSSVHSQLDLISEIVYTTVHVFLIVSSCCGLQAIKDLHREACGSKNTQLRDDHIGTESCHLCDF